MLAASSRIFAADGLEGLTLGRVASELDLVPAALYRYFPSKDALIAALQRRAIGELAALYRAHLEALRPTLDTLAPTTRAIALVLSTARFYLELPQRVPELWRLVAVLLGDPRALLPDEEAMRAAPLLAEFLSSAVDVLSEAARVGAITPGSADAARARTLSLWAALHGALCLEKLRRFDPSSPSAMELGLGLVEDLLRGWGADATTTGRARRALDHREGKKGEGPGAD
ncbi:MAG: helix-turn-helix domain-containing protein [Polyangiaceae bacterium]